MIGDIGVPELLIILVIVMVLFGAGRVGRVGKDLGTSIKEFRKAMNEDEQPASVQAAALPASTQEVTSSPSVPAQQAAPSAEQRPPALF